MITSGSNQHVALLRSLQTPKGRAEHEACLIEGLHLMETAFDAGMAPSLILYDGEQLARTPGGRRLLGQIERERAGGAQVYEATADAIERASDTRTPQGVIAAIPLRELAPERVRAKRRGRLRPLLLVLDAISDPGNMGTLLRSALAADVDEVLLAPGCADPFGPKVLRAGSGAHFRLPVRPALSWLEIGEQLDGAPALRQVLLMDAEATTAYDQVDLTLRTALIVGNEAHGASREAERRTTGRISIPMWNKVESLNAAIAASVILFEAARQRRVREAHGPVATADATSTIE